MFSKDDEEAVYEFSRQLHEKKSVDDKAYQRTLEFLGVQGVVELTALIGYYSMVAMTLIAHQIPLPEGSKPELPPLSP